MDEPAEHSELPPSSADKWFVCHAWRRLTWGLPDESSEAAEEGTIAHAWLSDHLLGKRDLADCPDEEMADLLFSVVGWIQDQLETPGTVLHVEHRVDFGALFGYVDLTGTSDQIFVHPKHLTVADLKYGRGLVEVVRCLQLLIYLAGAIHEFGPRERYRLVIQQPRAWHEKGPIREWWITHAEMEEFLPQLEQAIKANYDPRAEATPGDHCMKWCKAMSRCRSVAQDSLRRLAQTEED